MFYGARSRTLGGIPIPHRSTFIHIRYQGIRYADTSSRSPSVTYPVDYLVIPDEGSRRDHLVSRRAPVEELLPAAYGAHLWSTSTALRLALCWPATGVRLRLPATRPHCHLAPPIISSSRRSFLPVMPVRLPPFPHPARTDCSYPPLHRETPPCPCIQTLHLRPQLPCSTGDICLRSCAALARPHHGFHSNHNCICVHLPSACILGPGSRLCVCFLLLSRLVHCVLLPGTQTCLPPQLTGILFNLCPPLQLHHSSVGNRTDIRYNSKTITPATALIPLPPC